MLFLCYCGSRKLISHHFHCLQVRADWLFALNTDLKLEDSVGSASLIGTGTNTAGDKKLVHFYFHI